MISHNDNAHPWIAPHRIARALSPHQQSVIERWEELAAQRELSDAEWLQYAAEDAREGRRAAGFFAMLLTALALQLLLIVAVYHLIGWVA